MRRPPSRRSLLHAALLLALVAIALALRLYRLGELPYGMHPDEGYNALDALRIADGARPVFLPENNGREPLFMYLMAPALALLGPTIAAARVAAALCGTAMIVAQYALVRALPSPRPVLAGLAAAAITATNLWAVLQSHRALRAVLLPVWLALMLLAWWQLIRPADDEPKEKRWSTAGDEQSGGGDARSAPDGDVGRPAWHRPLLIGLVGTSLAGALWTYIAGRLLPLVIIGSAAWTAWRRRRLRPLVDAGAALAVAALLMLPLARYFAAHPEQLVQRSMQISIFNPEVSGGDPLGAMLESAAAVSRAFVLHGPEWWYANLAGRPIFGPLIGLAFLAGLGLLVRDLAGRRSEASRDMAVLLGLAFGAALVPSLLTEEAPRYVRMTALWPVIFALPALALAELAAVLDRHRDRLGVAVVATVLALAAGASVHALVVRYAGAPEVYRGARVATAEYGRLVAAFNAQGPTYVTPLLWRQPVVRFLNHARPPGVFDPRQGLLLPEDGGVRYAFDSDEEDAARAFATRWPGITFVEQEAYAPNGLETATLGVAFLPAEDRERLLADLDRGATASFGDHIRLLGARFPTEAAAGDVLTGVLAWQALAPTEHDHNLFVHATTADGQSVGQHDGAPLGGSYPTDRWRPGEVVVRRVEITVNPDAPRGTVRLHHGWYDWRDGARLPADGDPGGAVEIGRVEVRR